MFGRMNQIFGPRVAVRDCQTQTISPADLELALMQDAENANNHQREPEASVTFVRKEDTNKDRQEGEKPLNSTSAQGTGQILGERKGENLSKDLNAPDDPNANVKRVAKYAFGAAAIGVGIFVVVPFLAGLAAASGGMAAAGAVGAPAANGAMAAAGAASAGGSVGAASAGAAAGLGFGGAAAITGLYAAGEVTVGAVRYIRRRKNRGPTKDADTQTDLDKSD